MLKHLGQARCKTTQRLQGQLNKPPPSSAPSTAPRALFAVTTLCAGVWLEVPKHLRQTGLWFALGQISNYVGLQCVKIRRPRPLMRWRDNWFIQAKKQNDKRCPHFNKWLCLALPFSDSHDRAESGQLVPFGIKLNETGLHSQHVYFRVFQGLALNDLPNSLNFSSGHETGQGFRLSWKVPWYI